MPRFALFLALWVVSLAGPAWARNAKAAALATQAERFFKAQKYQDAAETLLKAYDLEPVGLYLYNIGRAYEQLGELELALDYFGKYVNLPRSQVDESLVKAVLERYPSLSPEPKVETTRRPTVPKATLDVEPAPAPRTEPVVIEQPPSAPFPKRTVAFIAGGVGIASLGTALGCALATRGNKDAFRTAETLADKQKFEAATRTTAVVTDVTLLVGAAAAITALVLFPFQEATEVASVGVSPIQGGAMAQLEVSF